MVGDLICESLVLLQKHDRLVSVLDGGGRGMHVAHLPAVAELPPLPRMRKRDASLERRWFKAAKGVMAGMVVVVVVVVLNLAPPLSRACTWLSMFGCVRSSCSRKLLCLKTPCSHCFVLNVYCRWILVLFCTQPITHPLALLKVPAVFRAY
eukprot:1142509-Pelagomonas_calceolata.AAC.4